MHIFELPTYPNLLTSISLSSDEIKQIVTSYKLGFSKEKNKEVEWRIGLPMFVDAFYDFIITKGTIPNQDEFFNHYLQFNDSYFAKLNRPDLLSGIKARAFRTYPSLVRDVYFNKYIYERLGGKCVVLYNTQLDIEEGIDLMIVTAKNNYGICFFTNTRRALIGRSAKTHRHIPFDNVKYVEMALDFKGSVQAGDFFLYGEKEYQELYHILSN